MGQLQVAVKSNEITAVPAKACAAENLATLRRLALNLLKQEKTKKRGIRGKMLNASWDHPYLLRLLSVQPKEI